MRRDGAFVRQQRIETVWRTILKLKKRFGNPIPRARAFALIQIETGLRPERIEEYLQVRVDAGIIRISSEWINFDEELLALMEARE